MKQDLQGDRTLPALLRRRDILMLAALVVAAGLLWAAIYFTAGTGNVAQVTLVHDGQQTVTTVPLDEDGVYEVEGAPFAVTLQVEDGRICFINAQCPDHLCEGFGWLEQEGEEAICLPAGVWVRVVEE